MPADGMIATTEMDLGTSQWQLYDQATSISAPVRKGIDKPNSDDLGDAASDSYPGYTAVTPASSGRQN